MINKENSTKDNIQELKEFKNNLINKEQNKTKDNILTKIKKIGRRK